MKAFSALTAVAVPIDLPNVDTDRIIPARFLRKPRGPEFARYVFHDLRFAEDGKEKADFVLNRPPYREARILVAAENFGCGSSREAAVWALWEYGFRVFIAPSFGDIFFENCGKNGALAILLPSAGVADLRRQLEAQPGVSVAVDLPSQTVTAPDGTTHRFEIEAFRKECLLAGQDEIAMTLGYAEIIEAFEGRRRQELPWLSSTKDAAAPLP